MTDYASANPSFYAPYITIQADGAVEPPTDQISRSGNTYTLTGNLTNIAVKIFCSNIVFDGAGHRLIGGSGKTRYDVTSNEALRLENVTNVTVKDLIIVNFVKGPFIEGCTNCSILRVSADYWFLVTSQSNTITQSDISFGIGTVQDASRNLFYNNRIFACGAHFNSDNFWDNGAIGNYWRDYNGTDANGDGIGDTPFFPPSNCIPNATDHYPLMQPVTAQESNPLPTTFMLPLTVTVVVIAAVALFFYLKKQRGEKCLGFMRTVLLGC
jgi:hypothetical protein